MRVCCPLRPPVRPLTFHRRPWPCNSHGHAGSKRQTASPRRPWRILRIITSYCAQAGGGGGGGGVPQKIPSLSTFPFPFPFPVSFPFSSASIHSFLTVAHPHSLTIP